MKYVLCLVSFMILEPVFCQERVSETVSISIKAETKVAEKKKKSKLPAKKTPTDALTREVAIRFGELGAPSFRVRRFASRRLIEIAQTIPPPKPAPSKDAPKVAKVKKVVVTEDEVEVVEGDIEVVEVEEVIEDDEWGSDDIEFEPEGAANTTKPYPYLQLVLDNAQQLSSHNDPEVAMRAREIAKECQTLLRPVKRVIEAERW